MINDQQEFRLSEVHIDGDPNRTFVVPPTPSPAPDLDGLTPSTNDMGDDDLIVSKENGESAWVKKTAVKLWNYIKTKLGISAQGSTGKYLDEQGNFTTPPSGGIVSHIGMIIQSTTLDTEAKVKAVYGGTTWIQLSGYVLRGATSGVIANSNIKDGGSDDAIVVSHSHTTPNHNHTFTGTATDYTSGNQSKSHTHSGTTGGGSAHSHKYGGTVIVGEVSGNTKVGNSGLEILGKVTYKTSTNTESSHTHDFTTNNQSQSHTHTTTITPYGTIGNASPTTNSTGSSGTNANLPNYKNVYIWERTA